MWMLLWVILVMLLAAVWMMPDYWQRKVYSRIRVEAEASSDIADPGEQVEIRIRLTNPSALPCPRIRLDIQLPEELAAAEGVEERRFSLHTFLLPRQTAELAMTVTAVRRGLARWNQATLELGDMFGLRRDILVIYPQTQVIVRPQRLPSLPGSILPEQLVGDIRMKRWFQEDPSLFTGVRSYQYGDPLKAVSWFASARTGGLMVKQFGHTTESRVILLLNGQMYAEFWSVPSRDRMDRLCEFVLQLAAQLIAEQAEVGFMTNLSDGLNAETEISPAGGTVQLERIGNRLGSLSRHMSSSLAELLRAAVTTIRSGDTVVLVTDFHDEESRQALTELRRCCTVYECKPDSVLSDDSRENSLRMESRTGREAIAL